MLDDHTGMYGSRTKWKLTVILLVLAGLALAVGPAVLERTDLQQWEGTSGGGDFMD